MAAFGQTSRFNLGATNAWNRRIFLLAAHPGEGRFTIPFADFHQCKPVEFTAYALASRMSSVADIVASHR